MNFFRAKTNGEYRNQRTGSYVDENNLEISEERYKELNKITNIYLEDFIMELDKCKEISPIKNDKYNRNELYILSEAKKKVTKDLLRRAKDGEITIWESSKISHSFSWETKDFKSMFVNQISDDMVEEFRKKIKKKIRKDSK